MLLAGPFEDGNGRIGRILMNAILKQGGFMPVFFDARNTVSCSGSIKWARRPGPWKEPRVKPLICDGPGSL